MSDEWDALFQRWYRLYEAYANGLIKEDDALWKELRKDMELYFERKGKQ